MHACEVASGSRLAKAGDMRKQGNGRLYIRGGRASVGLDDAANQTGVTEC